MGKFNQILRSQFIYMKVAFKDEYDNLYVHEDIPNMETLTFKLSNATTESSLSYLRIANGKADNCIMYKVNIPQTNSQINLFSQIKEGVF